MAGVSKDGRGYRIHWTMNGNQQQLRMKSLKRNVVRIAGHIQSLVLNKTCGENINSAAAYWLASSDRKSTRPLKPRTEKNTNLPAIFLSEIY